MHRNRIWEERATGIERSRQRKLVDLALQKTGRVDMASDEREVFVFNLVTTYNAL